ncbi:hypothetical protein [Bordetella genomosp. 10]|uniref:hypothetical protein n=1 Tax=Bordetella genomosp. 10 TaxID=1416804 RepID=UPI0011784437|nr:hypothetical protein [Bordetella genomosp. 10]
MSKLRNTLHGLAVELGAESPLPDAAGADAGAPAPRAGAVETPAAGAAATVEQEFAISTSAGRIHVQNAEGKVIDIGDLLEASHVYGYELDHAALRGRGFPDLGTALRDLAARLTFSFLDASFRAQPDVADEASLHAVSAPAIRVRLSPR